MNLLIGREQLLQPLQQVVGAVERKTTLPILAHVLLEVSGQQLKLTATDLEIELVANIELEQAVDEGFRCTLPARTLFDICKALSPGAQINLQWEDQKVLLKSNRSRFTLSALNEKDFPSLDDFSTDLKLLLPQKVFKQLLEATAFAMAQQDVRYYLNGLLLQAEAEKLTVVATDGHRLAVADMDMKIGTETTRQMLIPRKAVSELMRVINDDDSELEIQFGKNHIRFTMPGLIFTSNLIEGKYPDYQRVMPIDCNQIMLAERENLKASLSRIAILSNEKFKGIRLSLSENQLKVESQTPEKEAGEETIEVEYSGSEFEIGFNVSYMIDVLNVLDSEKVKFHLKDANSSCLITSLENDQQRYVIMPMRL